MTFTVIPFHYKEPGKVSMGALGHQKGRRWCVGAWQSLKKLPASQKRYLNCRLYWPSSLCLPSPSMSNSPRTGRVRSDIFGQDKDVQEDKKRDVSSGR